MPERSPVPMIPRHAPDDLLIRIEMLRDEAEASGLGTLAYLLELAMIDAKRVSDQGRRDAAERGTHSRDLRKPV